MSKVERDSLGMYFDDIKKVPLLTIDEEYECGKNLKLFDQITFLNRVDMVYDWQEVLDLDMIFASLNEKNYNEIIDSLMKFFKFKDQYKEYYEKLLKYKNISKKIGRCLNKKELLECFNINADNLTALDSVEVLEQVKKYIMYQTSFDTLYESNLRFVVSIAKLFKNDDLEFLELISEGNLALRHAIQKYDCDTAKLSTYAHQWISARIQNYKLNKKNPFTVSKAVNRSLRTFSNKLSNLEEKMARKLSVKEIAENLGMFEETVWTFLNCLEPMTSLYATIDEKDTPIIDFIEDSYNLENEYIKKVDCSSLYMALNTLSPKAREIIKYRYGLGYNREHTLEETGKKFNVSRQAIDQVIKRNIKKLPELIERARTL